MYTSINVNAHVRAKLTPKGLAHIKAHYNAVRPGFGEKIPWLDGNNLRSQLWEVMNIFGPQMYMSNDPMFEGNRIEIDMGAD